MPQILNSDNIPPVVKASTTSLTLATTYLGQSTRITIGGQQYIPTATITLSTGTSGANGLDTGAFAANTLYYCYLVLSNNLPALIISVTGPATGPTGFTSAYKYLAKFRTAVGAATIADVNPIWIGSASAPTGQEVATQTLFTPVSPTSAFGTFQNTYTKMYWRRVGDKMYISGRFECGTLPGSTQATLTIPLGLNAINHADYEIMGRFTRNNGSANQTKGGVVMTWSTNTTRIYFAREEYALAFYSTVPENSDVVTNSGAIMHTDGEWIIPIAEWASVYTVD